MMVVKSLLLFGLTAFLSAPLLCAAGIAVHCEHEEEGVHGADGSDLDHDPCDRRVAPRPSVDSFFLCGMAASPGLPGLLESEAVLARAGALARAVPHRTRKLPYPPSDLPLLA
ncbi:MAG: hypothetical protein GF330_10195 [Candidatus Eisenbacteria bacterium]|nr:hypothetical protein [Candidatus Eisenbacteria bacterium]